MVSEVTWIFIFIRFSVLNVDMSNRPYFIGTIVSNKEPEEVSPKR